MPKYQILVVDDEWNKNKWFYDRLFNADSYNWQFAKTPSAFETANLNHFDVVVSDVNLDGPGWDKSLSWVAGIVKDKLPLVLVSDKWDKNKTHRQVSEFLACRGDIQVVQTITMNELQGKGWEENSIMLQQRLDIAFAQHAKRALLNPGEEETLSILHVSDLQFDDPNVDEWAFLTEFDIPRYVRETLKRDVHFLAITGDISFSGQPNEYKNARVKLDNLLNELWPVSSGRKERILLVPGNHDVNLKLAASKFIKYDIENRKISCPNKSLVEKKNSKDTSWNFAMAPFRDFAYEWTTDPRWKSNPDMCWINDSFRHTGLRFHLLNSAYSISCAEPSIAQLPENTLTSITGASTRDEHVFSIAVCHHGPPEFPAIIKDAIDKEEKADIVLKDWPIVSNFLRHNRISLFLHGHGHKWLARLHPFGDLDVVPCEGMTLSRENSFIEIMAPTTHLNGKKRPLNERRGFNIIDLKRSKGKVYEVIVTTYQLHDNEPKPADKQSFSLF